MNVQIFIPCFMDQLFPDTAFHVVKVLEKAGCTVHYNEQQTCCGQPAYNAGYQDASAAVCRKFLNDFNGDELIITPSASCAGFIRNFYPRLFEQSAQINEVKQICSRVREFSEFLVKDLGVTDLGARFKARICYHDSCAALRECGLKSEPRALLRQVKDLEIVEMEETETCCGFGGSFAVKFGAISAGMGDQKIRHALATGAEYMVSTDISCLMHLDGMIRKQGHALQCLHLADVLAGE